MSFRKFIRIIVLLFAYWVLINGLIIGLIVLTGGFEAISIALNMILPQLAGLAFIFLLFMLLIIRLKWGQKKWLAFTVILGFLAFSFNIAPFFGTQKTISSAENQFATTFGSDWISQIPEDLRSHFRTTPFNFWNYYTGFTPATGCNVTYDIEYKLYNGNDSLRFDLYSPLTGSDPFPTIITIHGGGWTMGDKGAGNLFQMNRYLASQGYVVCDIMYGLAQSDLNELLELQEVIGRQQVNYNNSYTIPQMVANIGDFTHFLAEHAIEYKVNLSSIFVLGRSAGAHLAGCVALGFNNSPFSEVFNHSLSIRGGILFYPPTNMTLMLKNTLQITNLYTRWVNIQQLFDSILEENASKYNEYSPISYVDANSPPILILHGNKDKLVPFTEATNLYGKMQALGRPCILLEMTLQGHAFDMLPGNPYTQITYYYLERFLALTSSYTV